VVFNRPEYLLQPGKAVRRLLGQREIPGEVATVRLPWGHDLTVRRGDVISQIIWQTGVYDLAPSEVIWRLLDPGETALDVGANIGYVTSLMSARGCRVTSFEPHPGVFQDLTRNSAKWPRVTLVNAGLAATAGSAYLEIPDQFSTNRGMAKLGDSGVQIRTETLDEHPATFAKVDVEGFEADVFRGGAKALKSHRLRDIVFEDFGAFPTPAAQILLDFGYRLYRIDKSLFGPVLIPPDHAASDRFSAPNFLATVEPARAEDGIRRRGWQIL
jgi:FkbM family methyltransferase